MNATTGIAACCARTASGHVAERSVSNYGCVECHRERAREHWRRWQAASLQKDPQKERERNRLYYAKNKDRLLSQQAAKRAADPKKAREYRRMWWAANKDKINKRRVAQRAAGRAGSELNGGAGLTGASEGNF